jgi:hypothetical protein
MDSKAPEPPEFSLQCALIAYSASCAPLADALLADWPGPDAPLAVALDDLALPSHFAARQAYGWALVIGTEDAFPAILRSNRMFTASEAGVLMVIDRPGSLWALWRGDDRTTPCPACLAGQRELIPRRSSHVLSHREKAGALSDWISTPLPARRGGFLHPVTAAPQARACRILQDPLCPDCSLHAVRPNHIFFTAES